MNDIWKKVIFLGMRRKILDKIDFLTDFVKEDFSVILFL